MNWISAGLGLVGSLFGAGKSAGAVKSASEQQAEIQRQTADQQMQLQREMYNNAMKIYQEQQGKLSQYYDPYRKAGEQALGRLSQEAFSGELSPLYKMQQEELTRQLNSQMAARGMYGSGQAVNLLGEQQRKLGLSEAMRQQGLLSNLYNTGFQASGALGNAAMNYGSGIANLQGAYGGQMGNIYGNLGQGLMSSANQIGQANAGFYGDIAGMLGTLGTNYFANQGGNQQVQPQVNLGQYGITQQNPFGMLSNIYGRI